MYRVCWTTKSSLMYDVLSDIAQNKKKKKLFPYKANGLEIAKSITDQCA